MLRWSSALALAVPVTPQCGVSAHPQRPRAPVVAQPSANIPEPPRRITITRPSVIAKGVTSQPAVLTKAAPKEPRVAPPAPTRTPPPPPAESAANPKQERIAQRVSPAAPAAPLEHAIRLPEEVVLRLLDGGQPAFLRCWARAQRSDPSLGTAKVTVHLELDASGVVQRISTDAELTTLGKCISIVASHLGFPAPGQRAIVEFPLLFR